MRVLGLGGLDHNGSVAVLADGRVAAFLECERVLRSKNCGLATPEALHQTLDALGVAGVDAIGVADLQFYRRHVDWLRPELERRFGVRPIQSWHHHDAHALCALVASPFERATCVAVDGKGDALSASVTLADRRGRRRRIHGVPSATSIGRLWWAVSEYCGLPGHHSAGKVMALAAYGSPQPLWDRHLELSPDGRFRLDPLELHPDTFREVPRIVAWLEAITGRPAGALDPDVAASVQGLTERVLLHLVDGAVRATGEPRVCLSGGVALNGLANQRLLVDGVVRDLYVPPCTDDRGLSLGAAALTCMALGCALPCGDGLTPFLGPPRSEAPAPPWSRVPRDAVPEVARRLVEGSVVGVCRGRDEAGPRALGHRTLLASPCLPWMRDHLNAQVKRREGFRPFGCVVPSSEVAEWFAGMGRSPYMLRIGSVLPARRSAIPAALHVDGTSRIQTVEPSDGSHLVPLIEAVVALGHPPVLLNTSLNRRGEPLVHTVAQAGSALREMGVGALLTEAGLFEVAA